VSFYKTSITSWVLQNYQAVGGGLAYSTSGGIKIATGGVTSAMILDGTIATADLADASVTVGKLAAGILNGNVPVGSVLDYVGASCPALTVEAYGQAIDRTTYATLFGITSTTFGTGDGATTFNVPDLRGRATVGQDNSLANRITSIFNDSTLGASGGEEKHTMAAGEVVAHTAHPGWKLHIWQQQRQPHSHPVGNLYLRRSKLRSHPLWYDQLWRRSQSYLYHCQRHARHFSHRRHLCLRFNYQPEQRQRWRAHSHHDHRRLVCWTHPQHDHLRRNRQQ